MTKAIEERACLQFRDCEFSVGHLVAMNWNEFVIVPLNVSRFPVIYKYNVANDQWTPVMSLEKEWTITGAVYDPNTERLYLVHRNLQGNTCRYQLRVICCD